MAVAVLSMHFRRVGRTVRVFAMRAALGNNRWPIVAFHVCTGESKLRLHYGIQNTELDVCLHSTQDRAAALWRSSPVTMICQNPSASLSTPNVHVLHQLRRCRIILVIGGTGNGMASGRQSTRLLWTNELCATDCWITTDSAPVPFGVGSSPRPRLSHACNVC